VVSDRDCWRPGVRERVLFGRENFVCCGLVERWWSGMTLSKEADPECRGRPCRGSTRNDNVDRDSDSATLTTRRVRKIDTTKYCHTRRCR